MKLLPRKKRVQAFTLIELLVVALILVILWVMIMPATDNRPTRAYGLACMNNQKQIVLGLLMWASDDSDKLPWQVSTNNDGTMELVPNGLAASQFQSLSNFLNDPRIFICPTDKARTMAANLKSLSNSNISYFVSVTATMTNGTTPILTGDRHLQSGTEPVKPGLFVYTNGMVMSWTSELHGNLKVPAGMMSFIDGHVENVPTTSPGLTSVFKRQNLACAQLLVP